LFVACLAAIASGKCCLCSSVWKRLAITRYLLIHPRKKNPAIPPSKKTHKALFHGPLADFQQQQKQYSQPSNNPPLKVWHGVCSID
jgi:hypothetical protein